MSLKQGIPEPWNSALLDAGMVSPWGEPSLSRLADRSGVHVATISRIIKGGNTNGPSPQAVRAIAQALGKSPQEVARWATLSWETVEPYVPPEGAVTMTNSQRAIVDSLIREFAAQNRQSNGSVRSVDGPLPGGERARAAKSTPTKPGSDRKTPLG